MPPIRIQHPNRNHRQRHVGQRQRLVRHGVFLNQDGTISCNNMRVPKGDYANFKMSSSNVRVTYIGSQNAVFFKDGVCIEGYMFDNNRGWERIAIPTCSELPKQTLYDRAYLLFTGTHAEWVPFKKLPLFGDAVIFDHIAGTVKFFDKFTGQVQLKVLANCVGDSFELAAIPHLNGHWTLCIVDPTRANIYNTDDDLGYVERVELRADGAFHHAVFKPLPINDLSYCGLIHRPQGKIILGTGAIPVVFDAFDIWTLHLGPNMTLESLGDGHLLERESGNITETYCILAEDRFYELDGGRREWRAPWVMDCLKTPSMTVLQGAITLFACGSMEVFGTMITPYECFSLYGPNGAHAYRSKGDGYVFVVEGNRFECGIYCEYVYPQQEGDRTPGWGWGSECQLPTGRSKYRPGAIAIGAFVYFCYVFYSLPYVAFSLLWRLAAIAAAVLLIFRAYRIAMSWSDPVGDWLAETWKNLAQRVRW